MLSHHTPTLPWQFVSQDIFEFDHKQYLVTVNNFSDFYELDLLMNTQSTTIVEISTNHQSTLRPPRHTATRNLPKRMASNTSPHHRTGLAATAKVRQL